MGKAIDNNYVVGYISMVRPGSKHHVTFAIAFVTTRVHGFICTRDVFHVAHSGTLAALCSRYSIVGEPDGSW